MTFSLVARSPDGAQWGVAVASRFLAVGAAVPAAAHGAGAVATQALANLAYRPEGLRLLGEGRPADQVLQELTGSDPLREQRQAGVVDRDGGAATFTGRECLDWAGGRTGPGWAAQGNLLAGPHVVDAMVDTYERTDDSLARRLVAALLAGDRAGGDRRGRQSAALLVVSEGGGYGGGSDVLVDLRVDDAADPVPELARLLDQHEVYFGRPDPRTLLPMTDALAREVAELTGRLGQPSLEVWASWENLEERLVPGAVDPVVLQRLRQAAGELHRPAAEP